MVGLSFPLRREDWHSSPLEGAQLRETDTIVPSLQFGIVYIPHPTSNKLRGLASKILLRKRAAPYALQNYCFFLAGLHFSIQPPYYPTAVSMQTTSGACGPELFHSSLEDGQAQTHTSGLVAEIIKLFRHTRLTSSYNCIFLDSISRDSNMIALYWARTSHN